MVKVFFLRFDKDDKDRKNITIRTVFTGSVVLYISNKLTLILKFGRMSHLQYLSLSYGANHGLVVHNISHQYSFHIQDNKIVVI